MGMKLTADNSKFPLNDVPIMVEEHLFKDDIIIDAHNNDMKRLAQYNKILRQLPQKGGSKSFKT